MDSESTARLSAGSRLRAERRSKKYDRTVWCRSARQAGSRRRSCIQSPQRIEPNGRNDDHPDDRNLPFNADTQQVESVAQHADRQSAQNGTGDPAATLLERRAAENDGGDGVEFKADADSRVRGIHARGHDERGERGQNAGVDVDSDVVEPHPRAGKKQGLAIAADGEDITTELGAVQKYRRDHECRKGRPNRHRDIEEYAVVEPAEIGRKIDDRISLREDRSDALGDAEGAERHNEWRHADDGNQTP